MKRQHANEKKKEKCVTVLSVPYSIPIAFLVLLVIQMGLWIILTDSQFFGSVSLATKRAHGP